MISHEQLDNLVQRFMSDQSTGWKRESIGHVDPGDSGISWAVVISRRACSVAAPNSLWHIDGHHSLVTVIHGGIDDFPLINL